jgi:MFS family permease
MLPLGLFRVRTFAAANLLTLLLYFALSGALFFIPMALMEAHGYSAARAGAVFLPFTVAMATLSRLSGRWADRAGVRLPLGVGSLLVAASFALLGPAVASGAFWSFVVPVMLLLGVGMGIVVAPLSTAVMNAVPDNQAGIASGVNNAVSRVAGLIAVAGLGGVAVLGYDNHLLAAAAAGDALAGALREAGFGAPLPVPAGVDPKALAELRAGATTAGVAAVTYVCAAVALAAALVGLVALERRPSRGLVGRPGAT